LRRLTFGRAHASTAESRHFPGVAAGSVVTESDLLDIESRCRLKAEGARLAATRLRRDYEGGGFEAEIALEDPAIVECADRITDGFYWMNSPDASGPADISLLDDVGGCYETVAEAIAFVRDSSVGHPGRLERSLPLLAEAQSALRGAIQGIHAPDDPDQLQVFEWLKTTTARHRVYLKRFMRADDTADSTRWRELLDRIEDLHVRGKSRQQGTLIDGLRHHLKPIREGHATDQDWHEVIKGVDELVGGGLPPSDRDVRGLLLPVIDELPDRDVLPAGFRLVLREIDRFLATRKAAPDATITHEPTAEVKEARRLLAGRAVVLIGGTCRRESQVALKTALGLKDVIWIETREHQSIATFEPAIVRPEVALVLLAIRWSSHAFGDVKQFCDRHLKPLVRLPGGYSPNQVAAQVLTQCSEQLREE
jgi:hypothetical protein